MTNEGQQDLHDARELTCEELDQIGGGMKWKRGTSSEHVIDARGGSYELLGLIITFDINGNVSSMESAK